MVAHWAHSLPMALSPLDCLLDGQMKAWLLSMQMVAQVTLQLKKMIRSFLLGWLETSLCSREKKKLFKKKKIEKSNQKKPQLIVIHSTV